MPMHPASEPRTSQGLDHTIHGWPADGLRSGSGASGPTSLGTTTTRPGTLRRTLQPYVRSWPLQSGRFSTTRPVTEACILEAI